MARRSEPGDVIVRASLGRHLAFAPVAFAVTEGPKHDLVYANAVFRGLQSAGEIRIGTGTTRGAPGGVNLTPVLDRVFGNGATERDLILESPDVGKPSWSCTVWAVPGADEKPEKLVIEVRDVEIIEGALARQRAIAEKLLLSALREQDIASDAVDASNRASHLARTSRDLSLSLDESATRDSVRRVNLPRPGTWCIVDVVESNGAIHRLAVIHPDPDKQELARALVQQWPPRNSELAAAAAAPMGQRSLQPTVITHESGAALMLAAHGEENLRILREIGFGSLLVVPLVVRARIQGAITFVSPAGDTPFTANEIALALDLGARCAMALDNARLYREADALKLVAELANKTKSEFLAGMSHELRTPLNAIGGYTELIELGIEGPVSDQQLVALARIKANQEHLLNLISEILNFARLESGRMEYRLTEVSMSAALGDVADMLADAIAKKGLILERSQPNDNAVAWADADRVRQIFVNLVMNAVKYTDSGTITLSCEVLGSTVLAHVKDTGPGIPHEKLESIFEPFVQLTSGLSDRRGGVGLGLAISRDLARAMGGDLTVDTTVGVGSRFTVWLPHARFGERGVPAASN